MQALVMVVGSLAEAAAWRVVALGRVSVWRLMPVALGVVGLVALLVRPPVAASRVDAGAALGVGLSCGLALYVATRLFVVVASRVEVFRRHVVESYRDARRIPPAVALGLSLFVLVPAEEVFWRGLFQSRLDASLGGVPAAAWTWLAYLAANLPSASLPIIAGACVGGAVWAGLAAWSGGMLASLASHMLWTGLMLALPPGAGRKVWAA